MPSLTKRKPEALTFSKKGVLNIPEGYRWCAECSALTPHRKTEQRFGYWHAACVVCGEEYRIGGYQMCGNCGYDAGEECDEPLVREVVLHGSGCHFATYDEEREYRYQPGETYTHTVVIADEVFSSFAESWERMRRRMFPKNCLGSMEVWKGSDPGYEQNRQIRRRIEEERKRTCGCPRVLIYPVTNVRNFVQRSYASMDCMNALEWSYEWRCPICGEWSYEQDTNC